MAGEGLRRVSMSRGRRVAGEPHASVWLRRLTGRTNHGRSVWGQSRRHFARAPTLLIRPAAIPLSQRLEDEANDIETTIPWPADLRASSILGVLALRQQRPRPRQSATTTTGGGWGGGGIGVTSTLPSNSPRKARHRPGEEVKKNPASRAEVLSPTVA